MIFAPKCITIANFRSSNKFQLPHIFQSTYLETGKVDPGTAIGTALIDIEHA